MRILVTTLMLLPFLSSAQEEKVRTFMGFGVEGNFNLLDEPTLSFSEYQAVVGHPFFLMHSEDAEITSTRSLFSRNGVRFRFIMKGPDSENLGAFKQSRFVFGALFNAGDNYAFDFNESFVVRADTVTLTSTDGYTETLYRDTIFYKDTRYIAHSNNMGVFCEYLMYTGQGMPALVTGIGLAADVTLLYNAHVDQVVSYSTGLFDEHGIAKYTPVVYNATSNTYTYGNSSVVSRDSQNQRISTAYFLRPYIPVRLETPLSNRPKLAKFTVDINGKIGTEIQINPGASVNARMFYSLGIGLNYYL